MRSDLNRSYVRCRGGIIIFFLFFSFTSFSCISVLHLDLICLEVIVATVSIVSVCIIILFISLFVILSISFLSVSLSGGQHDGSFSISGSLLCQINMCVCIYIYIRNFTKINPESYLTQGVKNNARPPNISLASCDPDIWPFASDLLWHNRHLPMRLPGLVKIRCIVLEPKGFLWPMSVSCDLWALTFDLLTPKAECFMPRQPLVPICIKIGSFIFQNIMLISFVTDEQMKERTDGRTDRRMNG